MMAFQDLYQNAGSTAPKTKSTTPEPVVTKTVNPTIIKANPSAEVLTIAAKNAAPGQTAEEYLASRGGINAQGYYGDSLNAAADAAKHAANVALGISDYQADLNSGLINADGNKSSNVISSTNVKSTTGPTTSTDVLKSMLKGMGFNPSIVDSSTSYLTNLLSEGLEYDNAVSVFLNSKDYTLKNGTKITSPFYEAYGYLNEGLVNAKKPDELYNFVEGAKGIISKYGASEKFLSSDSLKKYVKNNVTVTDMDERLNAARLKAFSADPYQVDALVKLGHIGSAADLTDFYGDATIGKEQLDLNRSTGAFAAEALRRADQGITMNTESSKKYAAQLKAQGLSEAQIGQAAGTAYSNIGETLQPEVGLSNIFEGKNAGTSATIQSELEQEQINGLASNRRKRLAELATRQMQSSAGTFTGRIVSYTNSNPGGQI